MKKITVYSTIGVFVIGAGAGLGLWATDNFLDGKKEEAAVHAERLEDNEQDEHDTPVEEHNDEQPEEPDTEENEEDEEQTEARIKLERFYTEVEYDLEIDSRTSQDQILIIIHHMAHQKIRAEQKWGAVPLVEDTVDQLYEVVSENDYPRKEFLLQIIGEWKEGDFRFIDHHHNEVWEIQGGTVGKAYGILDPAEEWQFIEQEFSDIIEEQLQ
ncbi:DUF6241 domain-containing protein [Evansella sp. LMS18]|uniref:DUF6241 domain-containing protein n=1 Tax=Evansella sp. LMS18 TaxID=2924033 RepID=UPI0020D15FBA|nr:DUF6241 domain-containing protein [Evansella sp. LMS18]UTR10056.1 DUF6241 domain-containing protein [Evansella sp. LMS18]